MAEQRVIGLQYAPDTGFLVQMQLNGMACARQGQVCAIENAQPDGIKFLVVFGDEPFAPLVVLPDPFPESVFDLLLFFARRLG